MIKEGLDWNYRMVYTSKVQSFSLVGTLLDKRPIPRKLIYNQINFIVMKDTYKQSVLIFTGSSMIARGLSIRLNEIGITPIEKDDMTSALRSGFAVGVLNQVRLFIRQDELEIARKVIEDYFEEIGEEE